MKEEMVGEQRQTMMCDVFVVAEVLMIKSPESSERELELQVLPEPENFHHFLLLSISRLKRALHYFELIVFGTRTEGWLWVLEKLNPKMPLVV